MSAILFILLTTPIFAINLFIAIKNRTKPGALSLILFAISMMSVAISNYYYTIDNKTFQPIWFAFSYLGISIAYTGILIFVIQYTRFDGRLTKFNIFILTLEPVSTQILFWINPGNLFSLSANPLYDSGIFIVESPWFLVNTFYTNSLMLIALFVSLRDFNSRPLAYRFQLKYFLIGLGFSILFSNILLSTTILTPQELKLIPLLLSGLAFAVVFFRAGIQDVFPIARESVVEHMRDGWIVLDKDNRIVDLNAAAEKIVGLSGKKLYGKLAENILINWPNLLNSLNDTGEQDFKGSVKQGEQWYYLNIHVSPLIGKNTLPFGKLIVWRDITERRLADDVRQQARDEMFILLHSITSAASRALNLDDFLAESIYQIVYSSHSQAIVVYVLEESDKPVKKRNLILAAYHGVPISQESRMSTLPASMGIISSVFEHGESLLIENIQNDPRIPVSMRNIGSMTLLLIPMIVESKILGIIGLTRNTLPIYSPDEIARLTAVTDEVATFIQSNRRRQLSIALAERQRLVRDLHDSVTQKLYGLVTLSEAAQAGIKAGVPDMPAQVIVKIADNARQALKEMRLFLYQMQPVDFEKEQLVAVIQHRLAAVEGRADINTRLHVEEDFSLPLEKQLAFYFIAQEALNNVLKHAKAKNLNVTLNNKNSIATLEVEDDGNGFNPNTEDSGGIGLRSMKERALLIGGKLRIISTPGVGTKVILTLKNKIDELGDRV